MVSANPYFEESKAVIVQQQVTTARWPFLALSMLWMPFALLVFFATICLPFGPAFRVLEFLAFTLATVALGALWLDCTIPMFRPKRLVFSPEGLTYFGNFGSSNWSWDQFDGAAGGMKVTLKICYAVSTKVHHEFLGPFWIGGSDQINDLAMRYGWRPS